MPGLFGFLLRMVHPPGCPCRVLSESEAFEEEPKGEDPPRRLPCIFGKSRSEGLFGLTQSFATIRVWLWDGCVSSWSCLGIVEVETIQSWGTTWPIIWHMLNHLERKAGSFFRQCLPEASAFCRLQETTFLEFSLNMADKHAQPGTRR